MRDRLLSKGITDPTGLSQVLDHLFSVIHSYICLPFRHLLSHSSNFLRSSTLLHATSLYNYPKKWSVIWQALYFIYSFYPLVSRSMSIARNSLGKCHWLHLCSLAASHAVSYSESCIKGHRSSSCHHSDRPLFEIKKKGRPVSQCEKCRELRQSKKIHSKCTCNPKPDSANRGEVLASTTSKCTQLSMASGLYIRNS